MFFSLLHHHDYDEDDCDDEDDDHVDADDDYGDADDDDLQLVHYSVFPPSMMVIVMMRIMIMLMLIIIVPLFRCMSKKNARLLNIQCVGQDRR